MSQSIDVVLAQLDEATQGMEGPKPSQAWRYREEVRVKYQLAHEADPATQCQRLPKAIMYALRNDIEASVAGSLKTDRLLNDRL